MLVALAVAPMSLGEGGMLVFLPLPMEDGVLVALARGPMSLGEGEHVVCWLRCRSENRGWELQKIRCVSVPDAPVGPMTLAAANTPDAGHLRGRLRSWQLPLQGG